jgi:hypothetical protein
VSDKPISDLRRRMIADMTVRSFGDKTQHDYIRHIETFARFLGRSPDTTTGDDIRRFQLAQVEGARHRRYPPPAGSFPEDFRSAPGDRQGVEGASPLR